MENNQESQYNGKKKQHHYKELFKNLKENKENLSVKLKMLNNKQEKPNKL
jgi:chaperonin cofactor prefoldin